MPGHDITRLTRLVALLTRLQTKRLVTAPELAAHFGVSVRTLYRDVQTLQQAGVPIVAEEGKGYTLMEGYRLPPVMFTEAEAAALVTAGRMVARSSDAAFASAYDGALDKIKSVLRWTEKERVDLLSQRTKSYQPAGPQPTTDWLPVLQAALTGHLPVRMDYASPVSGKRSSRVVEPFALLLSSGGAWLLVALCQLRADYRIFRLDGIEKLDVLPETFAPHPLTLEQCLKNFGAEK